MRKLTVCTLALLLTCGMAMADAFSLQPTDDAMLDQSAPDTNTGSATTHCVTKPDAMVMDWDNLPFGWTAVGDATMNVRCVWKEPALPYGLYELVGGDVDETTVTFNSYVPTGDVMDVLGTMMDSTFDDGWVALTVPQATMQALLDETIDGLAFARVGNEYSNSCLKPKEAADLEPYLVFEATPEPATLSLLGIGGLLALRRRRG